MKKINNKIINIIEYKIIDGNTFFYVKWIDGTESWIGIENVSEKELVCNFIDGILKKLKEEKQNIEDFKKEANLDVLREQLLMKNPAKNKNINNKNNIPVDKSFMSVSEDIIGTVRNKLPEKQFIRDIPYPSTTDKQNLLKTPKNNIFAKQSVVQQSNSESGRKVNQLKHLNKKRESLLQDFKIVKDTTRVFSVSFHSSKEYRNLQFDIKDIVLIPIKRMIPILLNTYFFRKTSTPHVLETMEISEENDLSQFMTHNDLCLLGIKDEIAWILLLNQAKRFFQLNEFERQHVLFCTRDIRMFQQLSSTFESIYKHSTWLSDSFKASFSYMADGVFKNTGVLSHSNSLSLLEDLDSYKGKCIRSLANKVSILSKNFDKHSNILAQSECSEYVHHLTGFKGLLASGISVFIEKNLHIYEIFKRNGILFLPNEYIEHCDMNNLCKLVSYLKKKENWKIILTTDSYKQFKSRLMDMNLSKQESMKYKELYYLLKNSCVETENSEDVFYQKLKRNSFIDFRFVVSLNLENNFGDDGLQYDEAINLINKT